MGGKGSLMGAGLVRAGLGRGAAEAARRGVAIPQVRGKLLRPLTAFSFVDRRRREALDERFWLGCLAVQMAHEASLHHDDVLDSGFGRRNASTLLARRGPGAALLAGDLYLTGSYRVAQMTGSEGFLAEFVVAVEATVRGERMQGEIGAADDPGAAYEAVVRAESGALFGAAAALPGWTGVAGRCGGHPLAPDELREVGIELGAFYQLVDDFLDYCPSDDTGKPKLQDFNNGTWTFVLGARGRGWFDRTPSEAVTEFFRRGSAGDGQGSMAQQAVARVEERGSALVRRLRDAGARRELVGVVRAWTDRCVRAAREGSGARVAVPTVLPERPRATEAATVARIASRALSLGAPSEWGRFFARNSRSFSFAAILFPPEERRLVRDIYTFCRFTDDLVDEAAPQAGRGDRGRLHETLDVWTEIAHSAYRGRLTGIPLADVVMGETAKRRIPFALVSELIEGVRMDVEPRSYRSMDDLRRYTHRVASVVGAWLTQAFGVRDPWVLERAHDLGHAMQLTNIVRDVGEDLAMGRVYLPADRMALHGVTAESLAALKARMKGGAPVDPGYVALLEELMAAADSAYAAAYRGMPSLPAFFRRPVAIAAQVYRGIHDKVRANGHDNLNRRAYTTLREKVVLAKRGLGRLGRADGRPEFAGAR